MGVKKDKGSSVEFITAFENSLGRIDSSRLASVGGLGGGSAFFWVAEHFRKTASSSVVVAETWHELNVWHENLSALLGAENVVSFPAWDTSPYDLLSPDREIVAERIRSLIRIAGGKPCVAIASLRSALQRIAPKASLLSSNFTIETGGTHERKDLLTRLTTMGYARVDQVEALGEFSVRGEVIDVFSPFHANPVRIDFFDDEVESLRFFSANNQLSLEETWDCLIVQAQEVTLEPETIQRCLRGLQAEKSRSKPDAYREIYDGVASGAPFAGMERCLPYFYESTETLLDYFPQAPKLLLWNRDALEGFSQDLSNEVKSDVVISLEQGYVTADPERLFLSFPDLIRAGRHSGAIELEPSLFEKPGAENLNFVGNENLHLLSVDSSHAGKTRLAKLLDSVAGLSREGCPLIFCARSLAARQRLAKLLGEAGIAARVAGEDWEATEDYAAAFSEAAPDAVPIAPLKIHKGFRFVPEGKTAFALITENDVFGEKEKRKTASASSSPQRIAQSLSQLSVGDYVVHVEYGIGRYNGLQTIAVNEENQEFVLLLFKNEDKIFVPVNAIDRIQKYSAGDGPAPGLSKLGDSKWSKTKSKVREDVRKIASELVELYARRRMKRGIAFEKDSEMFREFSYGFPFQETSDQERTINEVLRDMETQKVVDRLVCGDVGFGKTEVAMRAACKAALDGYQVGVLCPTTILAHQHYLSFKKRFEGFPVEIDCVSRMRSSEKIKQTLAKTKEGKVDILIGTHRILSKDVEFKNLGLLVVDEEQRFGVAHKEKLRHLRSDVDTITMSATPIPRTLNMSMIGIRDISVINTPPLNRRVVRTKVMKFNEFAIKEAVEREIRRGGQVYFLHNSVESIHQVGTFLNSILPHIKIRIGHAQMSKNELEKVMLDFINNEFTLLLCTTIIESGLDIPNANTIIINNAQKFGLSQLYQLRGRVGRSNKQAYALLFTPKHEILTSKAKKRLGVLQELNELASGFKIAAHDMELRGIGNLLGTQQSGHIESVGLELYLDMIGEEVRRLKGEEPEDESGKSQINLSLPVETLFPESFIPGANLRLQCYKELNSCRTDEEIWELKSGFEDRFGKLPREAENLFQTMHLKLVARKVHAEEITASGGSFQIKFSPAFSPDLPRLMEFLKSSEGYMTRENRLAFKTPRFAFDKISDTLKALADLKETPTP